MAAVTIAAPPAPTHAVAAPSRTRLIGGGAIFAVAAASLVLGLPGESWAQLRDEPATLGDLPPEIASVLEETLVPRLAGRFVTDLNLDGSKELLLLSHCPVLPSVEAEATLDVAFQSLLMVFGERPGGEGDFPYRLVGLKAVLGKTPKPTHMTVQNMDEDQDLEIVWLQEGPDEEGRYSKAVILSYRPDTRPAVSEEAVFENPAGWVKVFDVDGDGSAEVVGFQEEGGSPVCKDLLFYGRSGWSSVGGALTALGAPDLESFQTQAGLAPTGKVTKEVLVALKGRLAGNAD